MKNAAENKRVLVTGGAGFIGPHLSRALLAAGWDVAVMDDLSGGKRENVPAAARFYRCDIRSSKLKHIFALEQPALVAHLAAQTSVRYSVAHPQADADINIMGTLNVITQSLRYGVEKFIFASSGGEVYGETAIVPTPEAHQLRPKCPYGLAKVFAEQCLAHYGDEEGLDWVALRLANVYGPGQDGLGETGIIGVMLERTLRGWPIVKIGDWTQTRDFVYIEDTVQAFLKAIAQETRAWSPSERLINIGTGRETSIAEVQVRLEELLGRAMIIQENGPEVGAPQRKALAVERAAKLLGWVPATSLKAGLEVCVKERVAQAVAV